jgi:hypothetical protein
VVPLKSNSGLSNVCCTASILVRLPLPIANSAPGPKDSDTKITVLSAAPARPKCPSRDAIKERLAHCAARPYPWHEQKTTVKLAAAQGRIVAHPFGGHGCQRDFRSPSETAQAYIVITRIYAQICSPIFVAMHCAAAHIRRGAHGVHAETTVKARSVYLGLRG